MLIAELTPGAKIVGPSGVVYTVHAVTDTRAVLLTPYPTPYPTHSMNAMAGKTLMVDQVALDGFVFQDGRQSQDSQTLDHGCV